MTCLYNLCIIKGLFERVLLYRSGSVVKQHVVFSVNSQSIKKLKMVLKLIHKHRKEKSIIRKTVFFFYISLSCSNEGDISLWITILICNC